MLTTNGGGASHLTGWFDKLTTNGGVAGYRRCWSCRLPRADPGALSRLQSAVPGNTMSGVSTGFFPVLECNLRRAGGRLPGHEEPVSQPAFGHQVAQGGDQLGSLTQQFGVRRRLSGEACQARNAPSLVSKEFSSLTISVEASTRCIPRRPAPSSSRV